MNHLKMHSLNKIDENVGKIARLFPNCVTEAKDENGQITHKIDFDMLKQELSTSIVEGREERYQFTWPDKRQAILTANAPINKTLRPCREESVDFDTTENLYIEGDNLEVLKLLQETYLGKIKMIYIDPPYNTGNDFVYNDEFRAGSLEFRARSGSYDDDGNRLTDNLTRNTESNGRFHTDWLNMMYPRLKLARDLLSDDGVIFISIDDNEVENLKKICSEIFGEGNFVAQLIWERAFAPKNDAKFISNSHDYVLMIAKDINNFVIGRLPRTEEANARYSNPDNDPRGVWMSSDISVKTYNAENDYPITTPSGRVVEPPAGRCWSLSAKAFAERLQDNRIWFGPDGNGVPRIKRFLSELKFDGMAPISILFYKDVGHSQEGAQEVAKILDGGFFSGPKPQRLMNRLLTLANLKEDSIILDFFSGSGSIAHAVMQLNAEDGGNRKFIMVQLPELTDEKSEAYKAGYKNICEIGKERIRRAGKQILELRLESLEKEGVIEKRDDSKFSALSSKNSRHGSLEKEGVIEKYAGKLSEIRSLEEVYGLSGTDIFIGEETSERGTVRSVRPNEKGCSVDSVKYCGGTGERNEGIYSISENSQRLSCRIGNTIIDLCTLEVLNRFGYRIKPEFVGGNQQNALFSDQNVELKTLSSKLSVLSTDIGFRVLKVDSSNMQDVYYSPEDLHKQDLFQDNVKPDRTAEDLLFQVMLDLDILLSSTIETKQIVGKTVYYVDGDYLVACFEQDITEEIITQIAREKPHYFVMRDSGFASDSVATNFEQIFATYSADTVRKVL